MKLLLLISVILFFCSYGDANIFERLIGFISPTSEPKNAVVIFNKNGENVCSGALIDSQWIATSATCALRTFDEEMRVKIGGSVDLNFNTAYHIKNTYIHPGFCAWNLDNDVALIKLVQPTATYVRTLKISNNDDSIVGQKVYALGYGNFGEYSNGTIRQFKASILHNKLCSQYPIFINEEKLCTYEARACEGDQGGPLVSENRKTLLGLISITENQASMCGGNKIIPVTTYTRISSYRDWIRNATKINYL